MSPRTPPNLAHCLLTSALRLLPQCKLVLHVRDDLPHARIAGQPPAAASSAGRAHVSFGICACRCTHDPDGAVPVHRGAAGKSADADLVAWAPGAAGCAAAAGGLGGAGVHCAETAGATLLLLPLYRITGSCCSPVADPILGQAAKVVQSSTWSSILCAMTFKLLCCSPAADSVPGWQQHR